MSKKRVLLSRRQVLKAGAVTTLAIGLGMNPTVLKADTGKEAPKSPNQIGFLYDQGKCINCKMCAMACKGANNWEEGTEWRRVLTGGEDNKHYLSYSCNHCEKPACAQVCPVLAYKKRDKDGIVVHNPDVCVGCKYCMYACPYHVPQFSPVTGRINKCHFCYQRQDNGEKPACVAKCPTGALSFGKLSEIRKTPGAVSQLEGIPDPEITRPSWALVAKS